MSVHQLDDRAGGARRAARPPIPASGIRTSWALQAVLLLAALNFFWQLGSSSYFVDEVLSVNVASQPLAHVMHWVASTEITPPGYFYFLHEWLGRFGEHHPEWIARLPSALAGVLLVAAVYWLASLVCWKRATALLAAALAACSPFVLEFAQRAQGYESVALAVTVAVAAALQAERGHGARWFAVATIAAIIALWLHYTAVLVLAALCVWIGTRSAFTLRQKALFAGACSAVGIALIPLLISQHDSFPARSGVGASGNVTVTNLLSMVGLPFTGRVHALRLLGVAVVVVTVVALLIALRSGRGPRSALQLVTAIAIGEPLALVLLSAVGGGSFWGHVMVIRYAAVAVPFIVVAIGAAVECVPRNLGAVLAAAALLTAIVGSLDSHRPQAFDLDARGAAHYVEAHARPGDIVVTRWSTGITAPLLYYGLGRERIEWTAAALAGKARIWLIAQLPPNSSLTPERLLAAERVALARFGYRPITAQIFESQAPLAVVLAWSPNGTRTTLRRAWIARRRRSAPGMRRAASKYPVSSSGSRSNE